jgi:hypothetical protein
VFDLVIASGEAFPDDGFTCAHISPAAPHSLLLAGHDSATAMLDLRTRKLAWVAKNAHLKKVGLLLDASRVL